MVKNNLFSNSNSNIDNLKMIIPKEQQFEINSSKIW